MLLVCVSIWNTNYITLPSCHLVIHKEKIIVAYSPTLLGYAQSCGG